MSQQFIAIITVEDGPHRFNDLRDIARTFLDGTPEWVEAFRITEATRYSVPARSDADS